LAYPSSILAYLRMPAGKKARAQRLGFNPGELDFLRESFAVEPGSADDEAFVECLRMSLSGGAWCTADVSRYRMLEFLRSRVEPFIFDELIRFKQQERDPEVPTVTGTEVCYRQSSDRGIPPKRTSRRCRRRSGTPHGCPALNRGELILEPRKPLRMMMR
jgi:hypothetical protein